MFKEQINFENKEKVKDYTSKIELFFMRHDEKEDDETKSDEEIRLTKTGRIHAKGKAERDDMSQSMAFGTPEKGRKKQLVWLCQASWKKLQGLKHWKN